MKRHRVCWVVKLTILGLALSPALCWLLIVLVAPTNWARRHVIAALETSTGRAVEIDSLGVCLWGNIELRGLRIASPGSKADPWLNAGRVQLDVSLLQLLSRKFDPSYLEIDDATLRVQRRQDGSLEIADSSRAARTPTGQRSGAEPCSPARLAAKLRGIHLTLIDAPDGTVLDLEDVQGDGLWERDAGLSANVAGLWNQGTFQLTARLGFDGDSPNFDGEFRASDVMLDERMALLSYAVPLLAGSKARVEGKLALDVYLRGGGRTGAEIARSLIGHGHLALDPVDLHGTPFMDEIGKIAQAGNLDDTASLSTDFTVQSSRITTDRLELSAGRLPIVFSGWTDFSGALDYTVTVDGLTDRVPEKARRLIQRLDLDLKELTSIKLTGDLNQVSIRMNSADGSVKPIEQLMDPEDRARLRLLGRHFREKVLR